ncbi:glycosyltransferase [Pseudodesulfovibrio indicus]|uniref:glycosyltransferase n=1 Tax=Pseudodesulfovibrio indicus TaxID=1716143 RepID=UPI00292D87E6|nr:glycosyltransferase [Pseudodesulfovibrio indicus]
MTIVWTLPDAERRPAPSDAGQGRRAWGLERTGPEGGPGWYRILARLNRHDQSALLALRFGTGQGAASLFLPVGLNGEIDHFTYFPFAPGTPCLIAAEDAVPVGEVALRAVRVSTPMAFLYMAGRVVHYLRREGTMAELRALERGFGAAETALREPRGWLEKTYGLVKQRMVRRSLPLEDYPLWQRCRKPFLQAEIDRLAPGPADETRGVTLLIAGGEKSALERTLASVGSQELLPMQCLVVGGEVHGDPTVRQGRCPVVRSLPDSPEELVLLAEDLGGDFVCVLEAGDELLPGALARLADDAERFPGAVCVYGDEERLDGNGAVYPVFKPDFDPVLQADADYVGAGCLVRIEPARAALLAGASAAGLHRAVLEGNTDNGAVVHVPRTTVRRTALSSFSGRKSVSLPSPPPKVSVIIPTRDRRELVQTCIESLRAKTDYADYEILVVDNGSREPDTLAYLSGLERDGAARVLRADMPFNYSRLNNLAAAEAGGTVLAFLNNDIEVVEAGWMAAMVSLALQSAVGTVGAKLLYPNGRIQHAGVAVGIGLAGHPWKGAAPADPRLDIHLNRLKTVTANTAACLVMRKEVFDSLGGFDETLVVSFNDVDLCLRAGKAGLANVWTPDAVLVHHESVTRGRLDTQAKKCGFREEKRFMIDRWGTALRRDPFYNPNLSHETEDGGLALFPPRDRED